MTDKLRILLVDDHILFRKGVAALISAHKGFEVVGEAGDGFAAAELAGETTPDIVLMDVHMPRCGGLDAIPLIKQNAPAARIIMLTISDDDDDLFTAIRRGADGYLLKDMEPEELFSLVQGVARGEAPLTGLMAAKILQEFRTSEREPVRQPAGPGVLTVRELEVLKVVATGATNKQIAADLSISENTVKIHLRNILEKLHLQNRIQAAAYAVREGLIVDTSGRASPPG
jgi:two-component system, NarL family, nitrate/nitrite response regulator NarL